MRRSLVFAAAAASACFGEPSGSTDASADGSGSTTTTVGSGPGSDVTGAGTSTSATTTGGGTDETGGTTGACSPCPGDATAVLELPFPFGPPIAVVGDGDLAVLGQFIGDIELDGVPLLNPSGTDLLLARLAPDGTVVWSRQWDGSAAVYPMGLAATPSGRIAFAAAREGALVGDRYTFAAPVGGVAASLAVYDTDGALQYGYGIDDTNAFFGGIDVDTSNRVVFASSFDGTATVPDYGPLASSGGRDGLAVGISATGMTEHVTAFGGVGDDRILGVAYTGLQLGPARIVGEFSDALASPTGAVMTAGGTDAFVAALDGTGATEWVRRIGGAGPDLARGVAVDPSGATYVLGHFDGDLVPDPGEDPASPGAGSSDLVVAKYDVDGMQLWRRQFGGPGEEQGRALVYVPPGIVVIAGELRSATDFDGTLVTPQAGTDALVVSLDADTGAVRWARGFGGDNDDRALALTAGADEVWASLALFGPVDVAGTAVGSPRQTYSVLTCFVP